MSSKDQSILYPGTEVVLDFVGIQGETSQVSAIVYPVSFRSLQAFTKVMLKMTDVISSMGSTQIPKSLAEAAKSGDEKAKMEVNKIMTRETLKALAPFVVSECLDLVKECVKGVDIEQLAHWHVAPIIEAWIMENFGSLGKLQPWIQAVDNLITQATGETPNLWETVSQSLSDMDIASVVSSTIGSQDSPTEDGASLSSTTSSTT